MSSNRARMTLTGIFIVGLLVQIIAVVVTRLNDEIRDSELVTLLGKLLTIYSIHLAVIIGAVFGQRKLPARAKNPPSFLLATTLATVWNLLLVWRTLAFTFADRDSVTAVTAYLDTISGASSFLVVGVLAYYFSNK
jgi:hypothetical protein